jgi:hypothetical protein
MKQRSFTQERILEINNPLYTGPEITDANVDALFEPAQFDAVRREADKRRPTSQEQFHAIRARCKRDLFFLAYTILGYDRLSVNLHGEVCQHLKDTENARFRMYLLPRNHFKTRIITIAHSIQACLPYTKEDAAHDPDTSPLPWPFELGVNNRVLIGHETHSGAARYLFSITAHYTANPLFMALYPECVPSNRKQRVNKWELELPRTKIFDEPTFDTLGVGASSQGRHYHLINLDDIYGVEARDSAATDSSTKEWFDNIQAFFAVFAKDVMLMPGTRYRYDDVYQHAMDRYEDDMVVYRRSVEEFNPETGQKEPIFPEEITTESLRIMKKNKRVYNSQMLNDPDQDSTGFDAAWKRLFYWKNHNTVVMFDEKQQSTANIRDMDIVFLIDPGQVTGGFIVTGADHMFRICTLVALPIDMKPPELVELIFNQAMRWQPRLISIEADALQNVYHAWLTMEMPRRGVQFELREYKTNQRQMNDRISGLSNYFAASQIYFNEKQEEMLREYKEWGRSKKIHLLDALAQGQEVWRPGYPPGARDVIYRAQQQDLAGRDAETGYSIIS